MSVLKIIVEPDDRLHQISREVLPDEFGEELSRTLSDMAETMYATGGVGLAAPQVGDFRRLLVADLGYADLVQPGKVSGKYGTKLIKMINPEIISYDDSISGMEGCLSVPDFQHSVERNRSITVSFYDEFGTKKEESFTDFLAVIIQHEIDHLNGITLFTRAGKLKRSRYLKRKKNA